MIDRRNALKEVRMKLSEYDVPDEAEKAIQIAKDYYWKQGARCARSGHVTINDIQGDVLYQKVYTISREDKVSYFGVTAYDRENLLYATKYKDGNIKIDREASTSKGIDHYGTHFKDENENAVLSQFFFNSTEKLMPKEKFVKKIKAERKERLTKEKTDKYKKLNKGCRKPSADFFRYMKHNSIYGKEKYILYLGEDCFCMYCGKKYKLHPAPKHRKIQICPKCGVESEAISRKKFKRTFYNYKNGLLIEKADEYTIVLRIFSMTRRLICSTIEPQFEFAEVVRIFVSEKEIQVFYMKGKNLYPRGLYYGKKFVIPNLTSNDYGICGGGDLYREGLLETMSHPVLKHIELEGYLNRFDGQIDPIEVVKYVLTHVSYPAMEWVSKSGFTELKKELWSNCLTLNDIFPKRKAGNIYKAMGIDKQLYNRLYEKREDLSYRMFAVAKEYPKATDEEWDILTELYDRKPLEIITKYTTLHKALKYIDVIKRKYDITIQPALTLWRDYINFMEADTNLEINSNNLFPKDLKERHDQYQLIKDIEASGATLEDLNSFPYRDRIPKSHFKRLDAFRKLDSILPAIGKRYGYKNKEMQITAPKYSIDIVEEGEKQHICVGNPYQKYIEKMAERETNILFLRRLDEPEEPFYTIELRDDKIVQVKGKRNTAPTEEVINFMAKYSEVKHLEYNAAVY